MHTCALQVQHGLRAPVSSLERALRLTEEEYVLCLCLLIPPFSSLTVTQSFLDYEKLFSTVIKWSHHCQCSSIGRYKPALPSVRPTTARQTSPVVKGWEHKLVWWSSNPVGDKRELEETTTRSIVPTERHQLTSVSVRNYRMRVK